MLQNLPCPQQTHHQSLGNLSEGAISDTISESSDNATLLSLSREDLAALGAGPIRDDVRVNRKKLESLILRERDNHSDKHYMELLMERTNTYIQWPSRMKIGAKTKKDLYIRVYGHVQEEVNEAKNQILADLGPHRDLRITLKMEISYTDHSHLIGCRGQTIRRVMEDTGCHIHFPDSNRMSKEHKSNQVTIAGSSIHAVELARSRVRELSPLIFQFSLPSVHSPYEFQMNPDAHHIFIESIQTNFNVQVTIHPPNKLQQTTVSVKGCEVDALAIKEAVAKIVNYFSGSAVRMSSVTVESTMEISSMQHAFVRAVNDSNIHSIMMNTGAKIIFPDLSDGNIQQIKRSRVYITGEINCVYNARQQLLGCLPLRMIFDLADDFQLDWESVRMMGSDLNVNVKLINRNRNLGNDRHSMGGLSSLPPPVPGRSRTIQLIAAERNASNTYEARRRILGAIEAPFDANVPNTYQLRATYTGNTFTYGNRLTATGPLPPLLLPSSPNMLSPVLSPSFWPPTPFGSPYVSPSIATCVVSSANSNNLNVNSLSYHHHPQGNPPPGMQKINLSVQHHHGLYPPSGLSSPVNLNPDLSISNMLKHNMHLPLQLDTNQQQHYYGGSGNNSSLNTPMSLGGGSSISELSPMTPMHPGVNMVNALINDFDRSMDLKRKAPGCERSNTAPNLFVNIPSNLMSNEGGTCVENDSNSETVTSFTPNDVVQCNEIVENVIPAVADEKNETLALEKIPNPSNAKKYMAVKAMYQAKIGPTTRVPNSEWAGCGFSKTHMNLFPTDKKEEDDGMTSTPAWTKNSTISSGEGGTDGKLTSKDGHKPLGHQKSNLLDFAGTRPNNPSDQKPKDLATLFIQNGLEKYIDIFMSEEIDLDVFSALTENDLRSLGVSSYSARKKMLILIAQLSCPYPVDQDWRN